MKEKKSSERFFMTLPKPIHDWLSEEADLRHVTIQDRIRVKLEEYYPRSWGRGGYANMGKNLLMGTRPEKKQWEKEELKETCYSIGKAVYDAVAVERKRLEISEIADDGAPMFYITPNGEMTLPILYKFCYPLSPSGELIESIICDSARKVAELENKLLSICEDGETVYQSLPFTCVIWRTNEVWECIFRVILNTCRTPRLMDVSGVIS